MAGKTLPGIGDDESGEHDASDSSDPLRAGDKAKALTSSDKTPAPRATDRMHVGVPASPTRTIMGGPAIVDDDKVAEGLKRLRSLDEPLGPIPNSLPTLKEGMPVVPGLPVPVVTPGMAASELVRSRGTAHGHALSTPAAGQGLVPMAVDDRLKGTLLGHSLHLPDLPTAAEENRSPEVRAIAARATPSGTHGAGDHSDFSHGDARFFESQPLNTEMEPEQPRSTKVVRGIAIFTAVISVFVVVAYAWSHAHKSESAEATPSEPRPSAGEPAAEPAAAAAPPTEIENTAAAPAGAAGAAPAPVAPGTAPATPTPTAAVVPVPSPPPPTAAEEAARAAAEAEEAQKAESPSAKLKRDVAAASAWKAPPSPPRSRSSHAAESSRPSAAAKPAATQAAAKPAATPGKHGKVVEDPDGTLPLSE